MKPERIMKSVIPIIMAGIVAIYGVVVASLFHKRQKTLLISWRTLLIWVLVLP